MRYIVSVKQMTAVELNSEKRGVSRVELMRNAAESILGFLKEKFGDEGKGVSEKRFAILCGAGNNGGDGAVLSLLLKRENADVTVIVPDKFPATETVTACLNDLSESGKSEIEKSCVKAGDKGIEELEMLFEKKDVILDCVFGTGFHGELPENVVKVFQAAEKSAAVKISVDIPSGINGSSGVVCENCFKPDITLVLGAMKTGLLNLPCNEICGDISILDIGISDLCYEEYDGVFTDSGIERQFPSRPRSSNKGSFGRLLNIAGCDNYIGAAILSSRAALRSGAGLVTLATSGKVVNAAAANIPECVFTELPTEAQGYIQAEAAIAAINPKINSFSAVTVGCGMGDGENTRKIVEYLLKNGKSPLIIDADGINSISRNINVLKESRDKNRSVVLTPHPGEFGRLTGLTAREVQADRLNLAKCFAVEYGVILLLKGSNTIIAAPDGRVQVNNTGNPALAKAGCGDVLTGIIGALAAQGIDAFTAAVLGAYLHGKAADLLVNGKAAASVLASEVADALAEVI